MEQSASATVGNLPIEILYFRWLKLKKFYRVVNAGTKQNPKKQKNTITILV